MKIYVCTDLEGISGVVNFEQSGRDGKSAEYERARRLLTNEVNTVVAACREAGAERVLVNDGHGGGYNLIVEDLHPGAEYVVGGGRKKAFEGMTEDFDGVIFLGYHAMAGTENAVLDHTQSSTQWSNYWVNGAKMGEIGQHAIAAGLKKLPVILVTGDKAACMEAEKILPNVETVSVKEGYSRTCAKIIAPSQAHELIRNAVKRALKKIRIMKPFVLKYPVDVKIEFQGTEFADYWEMRGWNRINGTTVGKRVRRPKQGQEISIW